MGHFSTRYYIPSGLDDDKQEFFDVGSVVNYMHISKLDEGELFVEEVNWIKIHYNLETGDVNPVTIAKNQYITNVYAPSVFQNITQPIADAISILAKIHLLIGIEELNDDEITLLIQHNHRHLRQADLTDLTNTQIDKTLIQLYRLTEKAYHHREGEPKPVQSALFEVFRDSDVSCIHSKNEVNKILKAIRHKLEKTK